MTGPEFLFMFTAVCILQQVRGQLLASDFTNAMLIFSELSDVNVETCIIESLRAAKITPRSILRQLRVAVQSADGKNEADLNSRVF